ncbi:uncharacterized protein LOC129582350 [Paramacrobiotus metropolitanus]|uniref:uncharacterized protein LOC129582350 n=1 Tax=Paramacrobiotus metropolitanus TaxID=2943436 RepID=UPI0024461D50|nr:uncharacterized protein LOC129582350 [Paramacrobiotus metropolitanus]XP_055329838.1 uncharacterized protein LOC129582350 [Paramacrobiotus metropolitanus]
MSIERSSNQELNEKQDAKPQSDTNLPFRHADDDRVSLGKKFSVEDKALARRFSGGFAALQADSVVENLVKAFLGVNKRVLWKPNGKQLLAVCEGYGLDVFALRGKKLPDLTALWAAALMREAATFLAPICSGFDLPLVTMHRKLGSAKNMTPEQHRAYLETLDVESLLHNTRAILDRYAVHGPSFDYDWLVEYLKMLSILFPKCAGYDVVEDLGEFFDIELDYGAVVTSGCNPKVVLIIKGFLGRWRGMERIGEHHQELHVWDMSKKMRADGVACFPERLFWLCFRGVHCGCGWQEGEALSQRFWPHEDDIYHDVRKEDSVKVLCNFVRLVLDRMMQCGRGAVVDSVK